MNNLSLQDIFQEFVRDLYNILIFNMERKYIAANGKQYKGLKGSQIINSVVAFGYPDLSIDIGANNYFNFLDQGRSPGEKSVPFEVILKWIKFKRIKPRSSNGRFKSMTLNQLAWVIQKSIKKIGIRARNFIKQSVLDITELYKNEFEKNSNKLIQQVLDNVSINFNNGALYKDKGLFIVKKFKIKR